MPGQTLTTDAFILSRRPPGDAFQTLNAFSGEHGALVALQRVVKKLSASTPALDLFDEASLVLESSNQGQTWFIKEARLVRRHAEIGRSYEALTQASAFATLVGRNPVYEESRTKVYALLRQAFAAFATATRPDVVYFKSLYLFARDEGYAVKQQWFPTLPAADRELTAELLNRPLNDQTAEIPAVERLNRRLEEYLHRHTEILIE